MAHLFPVLPEFAAKARYNAERYQADYAESVNDPNGFWKRIAGRLDWYTAPTQIQDVSFHAEDFRIRWYADGELNVSVNCLDRHLVVNKIQSQSLPNKRVQCCNNEFTGGTE